MKALHYRIRELACGYVVGTMNWTANLPPSRKLLEILPILQPLRSLYFTFIFTIFKQRKEKISKWVKLLNSLKR
jgi:hypothetical protein